jgi:hypothetical protein
MQVKIINKEDLNTLKEAIRLSSSSWITTLQNYSC